MSTEGGVTGFPLPYKPLGHPKRIKPWVYIINVKEVKINPEEQPVASPLGHSTALGVEQLSGAHLEPVSIMSGPE